MSAWGLGLERVPQRPQLGSARRLELHHLGAAPQVCPVQPELSAAPPGAPSLPSADRALHPRREQRVLPVLSPYNGPIRSGVPRLVSSVSRP